MRGLLILSLFSVALAGRSFADSSPSLSSTTNLPPYFTVYTLAVTGTDDERRWILELPQRENVRGNSTYANTRRYLASRGFYPAEERTTRHTYCTTNAARSALGVAAAKAHPRLFDFAPVEALGTNAPGCARLLADAEAFLARPPVTRQMTGYRLLGVARRALTRLATLTLAARLTNDARYLRRAEAELEAVCAFDDWNPAHFLDTAELALGVAFAYDALHDRMAGAVRERTARALRTKAIGAARVHGEWMTLRNNWVQVGAGGVTAALLALAEERAEGDAALLSDIVNHLPEAERVVAPDGAFPEGPSYWHYGFTFNALALSMMETAAGTDFGLFEVPGFRESGFFPGLMTGPSGLFFNFSDSHTFRPPLPVLGYFALKTGERAYVDATEEQRFAAYCAARGDAAESEAKVARDFPFGLIWRSAWGARRSRSERPTKPSKVGADLRAARAEPNDPAVVGADLRAARTVVLQGEMPVAVQRSRGTREPTGQTDESVEVDETYVAIKGGSPSYNHGHADEGSFVLDACGVRWAFDLGAEDYSRVEAAIGGAFWAPERDSPRWSLFRLGAQGHNTLLIDGRGQDSTGFATITNVEGDVLVDLTSVYPQARRVTRLSHVNADGSGGAFVDMIALGRLPRYRRAPPRVRWAMITDAAVTITGNVARLAKDGREVEFSFGARRSRSERPTKPNDAVAVGADLRAARVSVRPATSAHDYESPNGGFRQICFDVEGDGASGGRPLPENDELILEVTWKIVR